MNKRDVLVLLSFLLIHINTIWAGDEILLKSRRFTPAKGVSDSAKAKIEAIPQRAHVIIQLEKIPTIEEKKELEAKGIKLLSYISNKAWFASIPSDKVSEIASLSDVRSICEIAPEDKISSTIREKGVGDYSTNKDGTVNLAIKFFKDISLNRSAVMISKHNGLVIGKAPIINVLEVVILKELIPTLANEDIVHWINEFPPPPVLFNDDSRVAIHVEEVQTSPYNLTGAGVITGEWDGGWVDINHHDLAGRVTIGDSGSTNAHATHVAGTMLGNGCRSQSPEEGGTHLQWRGMAPSATVISYEYWDEGLDELNEEYESAINKHGIDISQNSWGWDIFGFYGEGCEAIDNVVRGSITRPISIMWAAANSGPGFGTIGYPCGAKNVITVGASYADLDEVACFSSRGPMSDGRIKPDVLAPGDKVPCRGFGIKSTVPGNTYDDLGYFGTSMATPAVSGSVALMLEDWRDNHSDEPDPLPSTIKAILIQTAEDLVDTPCNTGPDYSSGYGLINAKNAIDLIREDTSNNVILENSIFGSGDTDTFTIDVPSGQSELKITLVWDDYPGDPAVSEALVNDLDLIVKAPDQTRHYPWTLDPSNPEDPADYGTEEDGGEEDHLNNVEQVWVENPATGTWTIEIGETEVPEPSQVYSLISNFAFDPAPPCAYFDDLITEPGTPLEIDLRASDEGLPDPPGELTYIVTSLPSIGTLSEPGTGQISSVPYTLADNGNQVIYMSNIGGLDTFKFKVNDGGIPPGGGDSDEATITVHVLGLEGWWKMDDAEGIEAEDSIGDNDGEISYGTWTDGKIDGALQFDGSSVGYVLLDPINTLKGDSVSITAWVRTHDLTRAYYPIVSTYKDETSEGYFLYISNYRPKFYLAGNRVTSNEYIINTDWHHIAGTYDGEKLSVYVDGVGKDRDKSDLTGFYENYDNTYIGHENNIEGTAYSFCGEIDDVRVYYGALDTFGIWDAMSGDLPRFRIKNSSDETVAWFDSFGNLFLKGSKHINREWVEPSGTNDEFIVEDSSGPIMYINDLGDLYLRVGDVEENNTTYTATSDDEFRIQNSDGVDVAIINANPSDGDIYLKGNLFQNPE